jgi:hypothetical protein
MQDTEGDFDMNIKTPKSSPAKSSKTKNPPKPSIMIEEADEEVESGDSGQLVWPETPKQVSLAAPEKSEKK